MYDMLGVGFLLFILLKVLCAPRIWGLVTFWKISHLVGCFLCSWCQGTAPPPCVTVPHFETWFSSLLLCLQLNLGSFCCHVSVLVFSYPVMPQAVVPILTLCLCYFILFLTLDLVGWLINF